MIGHRYDVPIVYSDCAPAEALSQAFDNLSHLNSVISDMFSRIDTRIKFHRSQLSLITSRISQCQSKVDQLKSQPNRVTTLFSSAKYPAPNKLENFYEQILEIDSIPLISSSGDSRLLLEDLNDREKIYEQKRSIHKIKKHLRFQSAQPTDTANLFTSLSAARVTRTEKVTDELTEGLGRLPSYLPSISSILLFNSDENPYKRYVTINNLEGEITQERAKIESGPSAAPTSIIEGKDLPQFAAFQFEYKPMMGELPTFQLPANLPLGMLADISFGMADNKSIAPSASATTAAMNITSTLPSAANFNNSSLPPPPPVMDLPALPTFNTATLPPPPAAPPIAPPMMTANAPPPPPGPPPAAAAAAAPSSASPPDSRNALLDAIRNREKIKLKKATPVVNEEEEKPKAAKAESGGGDMMDALKARLARRNNALSGKSDGASESDAPKTKMPSLSLGLKKPDGIKLPRPVDRAGDGDEEESEPKRGPAANTSVMKAYMQAHAKKGEEDDEEWN